SCFSCKKRSQNGVHYPFGYDDSNQMRVLSDHTECICYSTRKRCISRCDSFKQLRKWSNREYIPYAAAVTAAIVVAIYCSRHGIHELSGWFNLVWTAPISWQLVLDHYLFLGSFDNKQFDPVIWSLVQEIRISIIFPLLMIF